MAKFLKVEIVEAITFDELVEYGKANGGNIVNDMPWSFNYKGHPVTHENDHCYLIPNHRINVDDMLITDKDGQIYPCQIDTFRATYGPYVGI